MKDHNELLDRFRGCLIGGAAGDALGYAVEFWGEGSIFAEYGENGITEYALDHYSGKAIISDDTQMTMFTANGVLLAITRNKLNGADEKPRHAVAEAYGEWLETQTTARRSGRGSRACWLMDVPELYSPRAPGNTCLSALRMAAHEGPHEDYFKANRNLSKGCGGVMRAAPGALYADPNAVPIEELDLEAAQFAAITHGNPLGYMPAAVLSHIVSRIIFPQGERLPLKAIVEDSLDALKREFSDGESVAFLTGLIQNAIDLSENGEEDLQNIHRLGEGWVGDEALAIAVYCALRHEHDFSAGLIASVNHRGDSDSTGAILGNILGALHGYEGLDAKWKRDLELHDTILELADDLYAACSASGPDLFDTEEWKRKYARKHSV